MRTLVAGWYVHGLHCLSGLHACEQIASAFYKMVPHLAPIPVHFPYLRHGSLALNSPIYIGHVTQLWVVVMLFAMARVSVLI